MTEVDVTEVTEVTEEVIEAPEFEAAEESAPREPVYIDRPIQTVGRRKEAVVRVRLVPGTGKFNLDGRSLEDYFPNKVHQQLSKLKVYAGPEHPHAAQQPKPFEITQVAQ